MQHFKKYKKTLFLALAAGLIGFAGYGVYNTAYAHNEIQQSAAIGSALDLSGDGSKLLPEGSVCNPLGCTACSGCTNLQYQQEIEALPSTAETTIVTN